MPFDEFEHQFQTEQDCRAYLFRLRWPSGFVCPKCGNRKIIELKNARYECTKCKTQTSVTVGTIFHGTHKPLKTWFTAIWWLTQKSGVSAMDMKRTLGLSSYETAWRLLQKVRRVMTPPGADKLSGTIEMVITELGVKNKVPVAIALELSALRMNTRNPRRVQMRALSDVSKVSLNEFAAETVKVGSSIITDGSGYYLGLEDVGLVHKPQIYVPHVHSVVSQMKEWLLHTYQDAVSEKHMQFYLDEFTFRFNREYSGKNGLSFYELVEQAVMTKPKGISIS